MKRIVFAFPAMLMACHSTQPLPTVAQVDLDRFSGRWFVIANIPTFIERDAYNATETYSVPVNGTVSTEFRFRAGAFTGPEKIYRPTGYVDGSNNAIWGMQFIWPFKADYRIIYLDKNYQSTVIGRNARDYVWIMARSPDIATEKLDLLREVVRRAGYDASKLKVVPQCWPANDDYSSCLPDAPKQN